MGLMSINTGMIIWVRKPLSRNYDKGGRWEVRPDGQKKDKWCDLEPCSMRLNYFCWTMSTRSVLTDDGKDMDPAYGFTLIDHGANLDPGSEPEFSLEEIKRLLKEKVFEIH